MSSFWAPKECTSASFRDVPEPFFAHEDRSPNLFSRRTSLGRRHRRWEMRRRARYSTGEGQGARRSRLVSGVEQKTRIVLSLWSGGLATQALPSPRSFRRVGGA